MLGIFYEITLVKRVRLEDVLIIQWCNICYRVTSERASFLAEKIIQLFPTEDKVNLFICTIYDFFPLERKKNFYIIFTEKIILFVIY